MSQTVLAKEDKFLKKVLFFLTRVSLWSLKHFICDYSSSRKQNLVIAETQTVIKIVFREKPTLREYNENFTKNCSFIFKEDTSEL